MKDFTTQWIVNIHASLTLKLYSIYGSAYHFDDNL